MSEVEAPPEIENLIKGLDLNDCLSIVRSLADAIQTGCYEDYYLLGAPEELVEWFSQRSPETWVRVLRWLAMEVI